MSLPRVVSRDEWLIARQELLAEEKELTRRRDALNAQRRRLPMVEIVKEYVFTGPDGKVILLDLFEGRRQLIVGHFMFEPRSEDGCPSCSAGADEISDGLLEHLHARQTTLVQVSRAPIEKIERYKARKGWTFPWYSSHGSDFNYDFHVTMDESVAPVEYNYPGAAEHAQAGTSMFVEAEQQGTSYFLRDGDRVFHTYSTYARGAEMTGGSYYFLDLTALGRQEDCEEPKGRAASAHGAIPDFSVDPAVRDRSARRPRRPAPARGRRCSRSLRAMRSTPEVAAWWGPLEDDFPFGDDPDATRFAIRRDGALAGLIQYGEEPEPMYRHAWIDLFVDPRHGRQGVGTDAIATLVGHLTNTAGITA